MKKIIKIGFPIVCIAVIGGTFILLNRTTDRINRNKLKDDTTQNSSVNETETDLNDVKITGVEEVKPQDVSGKNKAIEIVKKLAPPDSNAYYTNEGMVEDLYLVAIRDNETKKVKIYYTVDIENEKIEIYVK